MKRLKDISIWLIGFPRQFECLPRSRTVWPAVTTNHPNRHLFLVCTSLFWWGTPSSSLWRCIGCKFSESLNTQNVTNRVNQSFTTRTELMVCLCIEVNGKIMTPQNSGHCSGILGGSDSLRILRRCQEAPCHSQCHLFNWNLLSPLSALEYPGPFESGESPQTFKNDFLINYFPPFSLCSFCGTSTTLSDLLNWAFR